MVPSPEIRIRRAARWMLACGLLAGACEVASAAPDPARRAEREAKRAAREGKAAAREGKDASRAPSPEPASATRAKAPAPTRAVKAADGPTSPAGGSPSCPPDNPLTFRSFGAGFLRTWCTGCHSSTLPERERQDAPAEVNFDSHALYLPHAQEVLARAVLEAHAAAASASPMPPAGLVPEPDRRRLAQWIACGSPLQ